MNSLNQPILNAGNKTERKISLFAENLFDKYNLKEEIDRPYEVNRVNSDKKYEK